MPALLLIPFAQGFMCAAGGVLGTWVASSVIEELDGDHRSGVAA